MAAGVDAGSDEFPDGDGVKKKKKQVDVGEEW